MIPERWPRAGPKTEVGVVVVLRHPVKPAETVLHGRHPHVVVGCDDVSEKCCCTRCCPDALVAYLLEVNVFHCCGFLADELVDAPLRQVVAQSKFVGLCRVFCLLGGHAEWADECRSVEFQWCVERSCHQTRCYGLCDFPCHELGLPHRAGVVAQCGLGNLCRGQRVFVETIWEPVLVSVKKPRDSLWHGVASQEKLPVSSSCLVVHAPAVHQS